MYLAKEQRPYIICSDETTHAKEVNLDTDFTPLTEMNSNRLYT